jgi:hypothetical protein
MILAKLPMGNEHTAIAADHNDVIIWQIPRGVVDAETIVPWIIYPINVWIGTCCGTCD